jgi:hypothetical protein
VTSCSSRSDQDDFLKQPVSWSVSAGNDKDAWMFVYDTATTPAPMQGTSRSSWYSPERDCAKVQARSTSRESGLALGAAAGGVILRPRSRPSSFIHSLPSFDSFEYDEGREEEKEEMNIYGATRASFFAARAVCGEDEVRNVVSLPLKTSSREVARLVGGGTSLPVSRCLSGLPFLPVCEDDDDDENGMVRAMPGMFAAGPRSYASAILIPDDF